MKLLSLNVQHGGGPRAQALLDWIFDHDPDVAVLPEWRDNAAGERILNRFQAEAFVTATASRPESTANGVLLAARQAFHSQRITPGESDGGELLIADRSRGCCIRSLAH